MSISFSALFIRPWQRTDEICAFNSSRLIVKSGFIETGRKPFIKSFDSRVHPIGILALTPVVGLSDTILSNNFGFNRSGRDKTSSREVEGGELDVGVDEDLFGSCCRCADLAGFVAFLNFRILFEVGLLTTPRRFDSIYRSEYIVFSNEGMDRDILGIDVRDFDFLAEIGDENDSSDCIERIVSRTGRRNKAVRGLCLETR